MPTYDKKYFYDIIMDDYNTYTWICLINSKCEVAIVLQNIL